MWAELRGETVDDAEPSCTTWAVARTRVAILCNAELMEGVPTTKLGLSTKSCVLLEQDVATDDVGGDGDHGDGDADDDDMRWWWCR